MGVIGPLELLSISARVKLTVLPVAPPTKTPPPCVPPPLEFTPLETIRLSVTLSVASLAGAK